MWNRIQIKDLAPDFNFIVPFTVLHPDVFFKWGPKLHWLDHYRYRVTVPETGLVKDQCEKIDKILNTWISVADPYHLPGSVSNVPDPGGWPCHSFTYLFLLVGSHPSDQLGQLRRRRFFRSCWQTYPALFSNWFMCDTALPGL